MTVPKGRFGVGLLTFPDVVVTWNQKGEESVQGCEGSTVQGIGQSSGGRSRILRNISRLCCPDYWTEEGVTCGTMRRQAGPDRSVVPQVEPCRDLFMNVIEVTVQGVVEEMGQEHLLRPRFISIGGQQIIL